MVSRHPPALSFFESLDYELVPVRFLMKSKRETVIKQHQSTVQANTAQIWSFQILFFNQLRILKQTLFPFWSHEPSGEYGESSRNMHTHLYFFRWLCEERSLVLKRYRNATEDHLCFLCCSSVYKLT